MTDKERIEARCASEGLTIQGWVEDPDNGLTAKLGTYRVINNEDEDYGLYEGDEGELLACVVGAPKFGNVSVSFSLLAGATTKAARSIVSASSSPCNG